MDATRSSPEHLRRKTPDHGLGRVLAPLDRIPGPEGFAGFGAFAWSVGRELMRDRGLDFAASVAFRVILGLFPMIFLSLAALALAGADDALSRFVETLRDSAAVPDSVAELLDDQIGSLRDEVPGAISFGGFTALALAVWALSSSFRALMSGLNVMYDIDDSRQTSVRFLVSFLMAATAVSMLILATVLVVGGRGVLGQMLGLVEQGEEAGWAWALARWPLLVLLVLLAISLVYSFGPADDRRFRLVTPGTLTALVLWLAFALGFSQWVDRFGDYGQLYGVVAGVAVLMLYIFWSAVILFVGAEVDHTRRMAKAGYDDSGLPERA